MSYKLQASAYLTDIPAKGHCLQLVACNLQLFNLWIISTINTSLTAFIVCSTPEIRGRYAG
jgi:hypothetical protein